MLIHYRSHQILIYSGLLSSLAYGYLAINSQSYADASLVDLLMVVAACAGLCFVTWNHYRINNKAVPVIGIVGFALLFRLIGVSAFPVLEDDFFRYLWDGRMLIENGTPYGIPPSDFFDDDSISARFQHILSGINHPDIATIYGPVSQWLFGFAYLIAPGEVWPLQLIFAGFDMVIIVVLLKVAKPLHTLLYAWSPLVIKEFAFTAHPDVLAACLLLIALVTYRQYIYWSAISLALAMGVKVFAVVLVPILLGFKWRAWCVFIAIIILLGLPHGLRDTWIPEGLSAMAGDWLFNAPIYFLLKNWIPVPIIKLGLLACFCLFYAVYFWHVVITQKVKHIRVDWIYGLFFICLPALNPWYLVLLLPFAAIHPSRWAWVASVSMILAYISGINLSDTQLGLYQQPTWGWLLIAISIIIALIYDIRKKTI